MKNHFLSGTTSLIKKLIVIVVGFFVLFVGILLIFLPGPAFVVIPVGLSILALEFEWPRKMLKKIKENGERFLGFIKKGR